MTHYKQSEEGTGVLIFKEMDEHILQLFTSPCVGEALDAKARKDCGITETAEDVCLDYSSPSHTIPLSVSMNSFYHYLLTWIKTLMLTLENLAELSVIIC